MKSRITILLVVSVLTLESGSEIIKDTTAFDSNDDTYRDRSNLVKRDSQQFSRNNLRGFPRNQGRPSRFNPELIAQSPSLFPELKKINPMPSGNFPQKQQQQQHIIPQPSPQFSPQPQPQFAPRPLPSPQFTPRSMPNEQTPLTHNIDTPTSKPIVNPLLQRLFNKGEILFRKQNPVANPQISSLPPTHKGPQFQAQIQDPNPTLTKTFAAKSHVQNQQLQPQNPSSVLPSSVTVNPRGVPSLPRVPQRQQASNFQSTKEDITFQEVSLQPFQQSIPKEMAEQERQSRLFKSLLEQKREKERRLKQILQPTQTTHPSKAQKKPIPTLNQPMPSITFEAISLTSSNKPSPLESPPRENNKLFHSLLKQKMEKEQRLAAILGNSRNIVKPSSSNDVLDNAKIAVEKRKSLGMSKSSPEVWAAVNILSDFIASMEDDKRRVPGNIVMAIIQLTEFLDEDVSNVATSGQPAVPRQVPFIPSPTQQRIREELLLQKKTRDHRISAILGDNNSENSTIRESGATFNFETLPVV